MTVLNAHVDAPAAATAVPSDRATSLGAHATIRVTTDGRLPATAVVTGDLDFACADGLAVALCSALDDHAPGLLLDLTAVGFFDCAALHALEFVSCHAERRGRRLVLEHSSAAVDSVFRMVAPRWEPALRPALTAAA
jgi:anti-anti-sigma factor